MTQPTNLFGAISGFRDDQNNKHIRQQNVSISQDVNKQGNGASESPYYLGDYTYPQYFNMTTGLTGSTGAQSTGTAHTHTNAGAAPLVQNYLFAVNTSIGGYITCTSPDVIDRVSFSAYLISSSAGGTVPFQILREEANGALTQIYAVDVKAVLPVATQGVVTEVVLPSPFVPIEGERYVVRVCNLTSVNMAIASLSYSGVASPNTMHKTTTSTLATQTSFTATEAAAALNAGVLLPWAAFGHASVPEDRTWEDDFNRVYLGRRWLQSNSAKTGDMTPVSGRLTYTGTTTGIQEAIYTRPTTGDAMRADIDIHGVNANGVIDVFICRDRASLNGVALAVYSLGALIGTTINGTQTVRATYNGGSNEATWSIYYEPTPDRYTVLKDGASVMTWTDSSHVQPHGANYRFSSVMIECASSQPGGTLDNWVFRDWKP